MTITLGSLFIMVLIAAIIGVLGEVIAHRRAPLGIVGAIILGFIAIFLVSGVLHWHITGEPFLNGVPVITSIIAAAILVAIWSAFVYRRAYSASARYYRRGNYARRPRRRRWW
jgi:uncharacterized membrane protein YeaQ/YmgE (transglycosylase-associated protein family)